MVTDNFHLKSNIVLASVLFKGLTTEPGTVKSAIVVIRLLDSVLKVLKCNKHYYGK